MTLSQQDKKALKDNWQEAKVRIAQHFPGMQSTQLGSEPDVEKIAQTTGQSQDQVAATLHEVAQEYSTSSK